MVELDWKEIEILRAVHRGHNTAQKIRPFVDLSSPDAVRSRCKRLSEAGLIDARKDMCPNDPSRPKWGQRVKQWYYALSDTGLAELARHPIERTP